MAIAFQIPAHEVKPGDWLVECQSRVTKVELDEPVVTISTERSEAEGADAWGVYDWNDRVSVI